MFNPNILIDTVKVKMPYGKYKGTIIANLPISYLEWFQRKGFPTDKIGMLLATVYEIKLNGLDDILYKLKTNI